jgi:hypothetical protein
MDEITTYTEAAEYVAKHYVFNEENFPLWKKLNTQEKRVFAITHCLLNIQTVMYTFLTESEKILYEIDVGPNYILLESSAVLMINIFKLSDIMKTILTVHSRVWNWKEEYKESLQYIGNITIECERFNRIGKFNNENALIALHQLWSQFLSIANHDRFRDFRPELFKIISILV